ncbi:MAG: sulfotransferase domain-containing protein [Candidatus Melainabacteria bacterium]|nr:sulfotransferase domain-containing protein [Candidatus Melainabacteria bacterium]
MKPILLTTIPKAGTYFLAEILSEIGAKNRHLHVAKNHAENLLRFGEEVNKFTPSKAKLPLKLDQALYTVQAGEFVFGHIAKPLLNDFALENFKIIYSYRDHKEAMQAEFYWFREIRRDMQEEFTRHSDLSAQDHFIKYLEIFGPTRVRLFKFLDMWKDEDGVTQIDFNQFRSDKAYAQKKIIEIGNDIGIPVDEARAAEILETCLNKDTKTKVKRNKSISLWNDEAEKIYAKLQDKQKFYDFAYPIYWSAKAMLSNT